MYMKKLPLNKKLNEEQKPGELVSIETAAANLEEKDTKNEYIKEQFAQQERIYQRMKNPVTAMAFCLIFRV